MRTINGPGLFVGQYIDADDTLRTLDGIATFAASCGFKALQLPTAATQILDLARAAESQAYCDEVAGLLARHGLVLSELSSARQSHLLALHPAYERSTAHFAPPEAGAHAATREAWSAAQLLLAAHASRRLGLTRHVVFSGSLLWPYVYPYPPLPDGLVREAFGELARRWLPILNAFDEAGVDLCFELHPSEDLHDGVTFERFLDGVGGHPRCNLNYDPSHFLLQHMDYLGFIDIYHARIKAFHVKDAEFIVSPRSGVYGGYQDWPDRPGRFRSPGDGAVDFGGIFSRLTQYGFDGWATLEWECCFKNRYDGARQGAALINSQIIAVSDAAFDRSMKADASREQLRRILGLA